MRSLLASCQYHTLGANMRRTTLKHIFSSLNSGTLASRYAQHRKPWPLSLRPEIILVVALHAPICRLTTTQPASPAKLAAGLARLHKESTSPTRKFGFHMATCHAKIAQAVDTWEDSWCALYTRHLGHVMNLAKPILQWPDFDVVCKLTLEKVVLRLLLPLQSEGRFLKPCLVHGDCWDGNTALDQQTRDAFVFDVCSFYSHNEYDTGNWRAPRHRMSNKAYIQEYKSKFPISPPEQDWDARNHLYSLTFNIGNTIYIPGSSQRHVVFDDMMTLCKMFCADELVDSMKNIGSKRKQKEWEEKGIPGQDEGEDDSEQEATADEEEEEEDD